MHNLYFYNRLMADIRCALEEDRFETFYEQKREIYGRRIWIIFVFKNGQNRIAALCRIFIRDVFFRNAYADKFT